MTRWLLLDRRLRPSPEPSTYDDPSFTLALPCFPLPITSPPSPVRMVVPLYILPFLLAAVALAQGITTPSGWVRPLAYTAEY